MSRIGKQPISVPKGVDISISGDVVNVKGPKGQLKVNVLPGISAAVEDGLLNIVRADLEGAAALAEKVRTAIAESSFILDDSLRPMRVTVSIGVANYDGNRKRFFQKTDQALYRAKAAGKNCVVLDGGE